MPEPIYYEVLDPPARATRYFRVVPGNYEFWDDRTRRWVPATSDAARDWFNRSVESADAVLTTAAAVQLDIRETKGAQ